MFTLQEILTATEGRLICGSLRKRICGVSIDSRNIKPDELFIAIKGEHFDGHNFIQQAIDKKAAVILYSRNKQSVPLLAQGKAAFIQVKDTIKALGDIGHYHRKRFNIPIVAVTGSNGKTTTKEMIAAILRRRYSVLKNEGTKNNLIGIPLSLLKLEAKHKVAVMELGMSEFGEIARLSQILQPSFGVITNIGPSHLHNLKDLTAVAKAKGELLKNLDNNAIAILNKDDNYFKTIKQNFKGRVVTFGINKPSSFRATQYSSQNEKLRFIVNDSYPFLLRACGVHNLYNALASIAVCAQLGINYEIFLRSLATFSPLPLRGEIKKVGRLTLIDDSYNSNPQSLSSAIGFLLQYKCRGKRILVIGDMLELGVKERTYHTRLGRIIGKSKIDILLAFGKLSKALAQSAEKEGMDKCSIFVCKDKHKVLEVLLDKVSPGDVILIKGSRAMNMEEITRCFITSYTL
jgi:UDP-N-acetylmuramoyl-tripeptide--D-alanyl-D-alanine ligase